MEAEGQGCIPQLVLGEMALEIHELGVFWFFFIFKIVLDNMETEVVLNTDRQSERHCWGCQTKGLITEAPGASGMAAEVPCYQPAHPKSSPSADPQARPKVQSGQQKPQKYWAHLDPSSVSPAPPGSPRPPRNHCRCIPTCLPRWASRVLESRP